MFNTVWLVNNSEYLVYKDRGLMVGVVTGLQQSPQLENNNTLLFFFDSLNLNLYITAAA